MASPTPSGITVEHSAGTELLARNKKHEAIGLVVDHLTELVNDSNAAANSYIRRVAHAHGSVPTYQREHMAFMATKKKLTMHLSTASSRGHQDVRDTCNDVDSHLSWLKNTAKHTIEAARKARAASAIHRADADASSALRDTIAAAHCAFSDEMRARGITLFRYNKSASVKRAKQRQMVLPVDNYDASNHIRTGIISANHKSINRCSHYMNSVGSNPCTVKVFADAKQRCQIDLELNTGLANQC
jgi:hypothetical protein